LFALFFAYFPGKGKKAGGQNGERGPVFSDAKMKAIWCETGDGRE